MATQQSLEKQYAKLETVDLLEIVSRKDDYIELANAVALQELKNRDIPTEEINSYQSVFAFIPTADDVKNHLTDINWFHKLFCYLVLIPRLRIALSGSFIKYHQTLKAQQASYYTVMGIVFFIIAIPVSINFNSSYFITIWLAGFVITYLFDMGYNRERQTGNIQKLLDEGKRPNASGFMN